MAIVCCASSMSSARLLHAVPKRLMEQARWELWLFNCLRLLPHCGKSLNDSSGRSMSEQERESPLPSQRGNQHNQLIPGGRIEANVITCTNVVSGSQYSGKQVIQVSREQSQGPI